MRGAFVFHRGADHATRVGDEVRHHQHAPLVEELLQALPEPAADAGVLLECARLLLKAGRIPRGIELLRRIKQESPETEVIMITGHGDMELAIDSLKLQATDFITKPINIDALEVAIQRAKNRLTMRRKLHEYTCHLEQLIREKTEWVKAEIAKTYTEAPIDRIVAPSVDGHSCGFASPSRGRSRSASSPGTRSVTGSAPQRITVRRSAASSG